MRKAYKAVFAAVAALFVASSAPALATPTSISSQPSIAINGTITAGAAALNWTACDSVNGNSVILTGREVLLIQNSGASPYTVTVSSVADQLGRFADITAYSLPATSFAFFGPFPLNGWAQTTNPRTLNFTGSNVAVKFAVIQLPSSY